MNGQEFIYALERLGLVNVNNVDGQSYSWMFDHELLLPFLDWFCAELQTTNVLKLSELNR